MRRLGVWLATGAGLGYSPVAPGTAGSILALGIYALTRDWSLAAQIGLAAAVAAVGIWASYEGIGHFRKSDPSHVVIDEVAGQLVTLAGASVGVGGALLGFVLFRAFDILKPWPVNKLEALPGGLGIMADDLMAGAYACAILHGALWLAPGIR